MNEIVDTVNHTFDIVYISEGHPDVVGYYVSSSDVDSEEWSWHDIGNGLEIASDLVIGAFRTLEAARGYCAGKLMEGKS